MATIQITSNDCANYSQREKPAIQLVFLSEFGIHRTFDATDETQLAIDCFESDWRSPCEYQLVPIELTSAHYLPTTNCSPIKRVKATSGCPIAPLPSPFISIEAFHQCHWCVCTCIDRSGTVARHVGFQVRILHFVGNFRTCAIVAIRLHFEAF